MATPNYATALQQINDYIVANGNNEITANVLNPVLKIILDFANNNIGDLNTLTTDQKNTIVEAINSLKNNFDDLVNNGVQLYTGINDPNDTPPPSYKYADFYMQVDIYSLPVKLWQWNGFVWTDESQEPATESDNVINNSEVIGVTVTDALNTLNTSKENISNKVIDFSIVNNILYPSVQAVKTYADSLLVGVINLRGVWDASTNLFPTTGGSGTSGAIRKGDLWYVSVAGVLAGKNVNIGDSFFAVVNTPGQTASNWNVIESNIGYVPANDANVIHTTGNETKNGDLTVNNLILKANPINTSSFSVSQEMAINDIWRIYGTHSASEQGEMVIEVGDNAMPFSSGGQRFRFHYDNSSSGTAKDPLIIDYSVSTFDTDVALNGATPSTIASFDASKNIKSLPLSTYPSLSELAFLKGVTSAIQTQLNSKQNNLTNPITGVGTINFIPKFTSASVLGVSSITDNGSIVIIGNPAYIDTINPNTGDILTLLNGGTNKLYINGIAGIANLAGTGTRTVVADASGNLSATSTPPDSRPYKVYTGSINLTASAATIGNLDENTLGGSLTWSRTGTGTYTGVGTGLFPTSGKVRMFFSNNQVNGSIEVKGNRTDANTITLTTVVAGVLTDNVVTGMSIEIRVYN